MKHETLDAAAAVKLAERLKKKPRRVKCRKPKTVKPGESPSFRAVVNYCRARGYPLPEPEFRFHPVRKWRFDAVWKDRMLAVEFHGGAFIAGRHTRGVGFSNDCEKFAHAAVMGWRMAPVTTQQLDRGELWPLLDYEFGRGAA